MQLNGTEHKATPKCDLALQDRGHLLSLKKKIQDRIQTSSQTSNAEEEKDEGSGNNQKFVDHFKKVALQELIKNAPIMKSPIDLDQSIFNKLWEPLLKHKNGECMLISSETGISGKLISAVGEIYSKIKSGSSKLFIGRMEGTFGIIHRLLLGIRFHPTHKSTLVFRSSMFKPGNWWVKGEHIEMLIQLM
jgi:hypothetical protein